MMNFTFNSVNSADLGIIIPKTVFRPSWAEAVEDISIAGRPAIIKQPTGIYNNEALTIDCVITDASKLQLIREAYTGKGRLILSTAPNEYINARADVLVPQGVALDMAQIAITFDCAPFAYSITPTTTELTTSYTAIENNAKIYTAPTFRFKIAQTAAPILKGDVNFDGKVDARDASLVLAEYQRISTGQPPTFTPEQFEAADMDNNGIIDARDASLILAAYNAGSTSGGEDPETPAEQIELDVNGAITMIGLPSEVLSNGFTVTVDCERYLIYYEDTEGNYVNIMQYSSLDLPILHEGTNYVRYVGNIVEHAEIIVNERWY